MKQWFKNKVTATKRWALTHVLGWLTGLSSDDFGKVYGWVYEAEHTHDDGNSAGKAQTVNQRIKAAWPQIAGWALNLLRELAVAYLKKTLP